MDMSSSVHALDDSRVSGQHDEPRVAALRTAATLAGSSMPRDLSVTVEYLSCGPGSSQDRTCSPQ